MLKIATLLAKTLWAGLGIDSFRLARTHAYKYDFTNKACPTPNLPTAPNSKPLQNKKYRIAILKPNYFIALIRLLSAGVASRTKRRITKSSISHSAPNTYRFEAGQINRIWNWVALSPLNFLQFT